jgi:hypothetical protein
MVALAVARSTMAWKPRFWRTALTHKIRRAILCQIFPEIGVKMSEQRLDFLI